MHYVTIILKYYSKFAKSEMDGNAYVPLQHNEPWKIIWIH